MVSIVKRMTNRKATNIDSKHRQDDKCILPGSAGEHSLQKQYGTSKRAEKFYSNQVLDHLNEEMLRFIHRMEIMFVSTADMNGKCDCTI